MQLRTARASFRLLGPERLGWKVGAMGAVCKDNNAMQRLFRKKSPRSRKSLRSKKCFIRFDLISIPGINLERREVKRWRPFAGSQAVTAPVRPFSMTKVFSVASVACGSRTSEITCRRVVMAARVRSMER